MYQYKVEIIIDSEDPYSKEELTKIVNENMLAYADGAPFDIVIGDIICTEPGPKEQSEKTCDHEGEHLYGGTKNLKCVKCGKTK